MADRHVHADRRMTDVEALMWNLEKDPHLSSSIANVTVLDRPPDRDVLRQRMAAATHAIPRLRQRVVPALGRLAPPEWRLDPDFDLDYHVRASALPSPGDERALFDLAAAITNTPFDRTRPLWEFHVVEGLEGGRAALIQKLHHSITDGEGGIRMSEQFIDIARDATEPMVTRTPVELEAEPSSFVGTVLDTMGHNVRRQLGIAARAVRGAAHLARHPNLLVETGDDVVELARSATRQLVVTGSALSPLWRERSLRRHVEPLRVSFDDTKRAAKALGGSLNDAFVTAATGGAGAYHRALGVDVDELRMAMPVSTRTDRSAGGNAFTPTRLLVPAGIADPAERFAVIRDRIQAVRGERAISAANALAGVTNLLPTSLLVRFARQQVETIDFATSNVRAAPIELFIAGALIEANYPIGPTGGTAFNLTLMSYRGSLDMGLNVDVGAVEQPELLRRCIEEAFDEVLSR